ncbi:putative sulfate exporter family transporter [Kroppenstedtia pulmonis]|uniref:Putative sulfate exporter family transporter n=1 Tax=Kroppenstedtia pulmonis TaxID=1380685 RepID=A0A7D3Y2X9_9BACL|nr:putative sulfate exporter family transporter [Kroppenstedtia pulmonis]QKG85243.1 putative sulfate exporter family transporter [Kroppenstedtia pulmonis]
MKKTILQDKEDVHCKSRLYFTGGILFTFLLAGAGYLLAVLPGVSLVGPMITAILLAVSYRHVFGYPEHLREGIQFSSKIILRFAIILFGFRLNLEQILGEGLNLLWKDAVVIFLGLGVTLFMARVLRGNFNLSFLLGVGTGVCGAAAIAAVSPIIKADEEDTATGVGIIALMGTMFTLLYTLLLPILPFHPDQYGMWSGLSLHELAHVAAASAPAGEDAVALALLAKLGRVLLLVPLCFLIILWRRRKGHNESSSKVAFPWFLVGFVATCLIGSYMAIPKAMIENLGVASSFLLASAMVGLGLNIHIGSLKEKALKPLLAMLTASIVLAVVSGWLVLI